MGRYSKANSFFFMFYKKSGKEPTLQEFTETTGLKKSSYYRARQKHRLWQWLKDKNIDDGAEFEFGLIRVVEENNVEGGIKLP